MAEKSGSKSSGLVPRQGERSLIVGATGSGKTNFAAWLLERLDHSPVVIYDTKSDDKFTRLPRSTVVNSIIGADEAIDNLETDYIVLRPSIYDAHDPEILDEMLLHHHLHWPNVAAYIDELYHFHSGGRAGPGLVGLYRQGRARGQTTIGAAQRPAWFNRSAITEAQTIHTFMLSDDEDWKSMSKIVRGLRDLPRPKPHHFYFYRIGDEHPTLVKPVPLVGGVDPGYIDPAPATESDGETRPGPLRHLWIGR